MQSIVNYLFNLKYKVSYFVSVGNSFCVYSFRNLLLDSLSNHVECIDNKNSFIFNGIPAVWIEFF